LRSGPNSGGGRGQIFKTVKENKKVIWIQATFCISLFNKFLFVFAPMLKIQFLLKCLLRKVWRRGGGKPKRLTIIYKRIHKAQHIEQHEPRFPLLNKHKILYNVLCSIRQASVQAIDYLYILGTGQKPPWT
jgi:hypothetical protein